MTCPDCTARRESPQWPMHDPLCIYCGAALIQNIRRLHSPTPAEKSARCKAVLADWVRFGHSEARIRALVDGPVALEPVEKRTKGSK